MSNQTYNISKKYTDRLYYGQYQYCCKFFLNEAGVIRGLKMEDIDHIVQRRNEWRSSGFYHSYKQITTSMRDNLVDMCGCLQGHGKDIKFIASYNYGYVYTSNIDVIKDILSKSYTRLCSVTEAVVDRPLNTIKLKDPKWSHRTYFKERNISATQQNSLNEFLKSRTNLRISPGLIDWMNTADDHWNKSWLMGYYFVDHNNDGELLFLNMVAPGVIGKTCTIIAK